MLAFVLFLWTGNGAAFAERVAWDPAKTRAVIVGVLEWENPSISTFSAADRKDQELYDALLARGVPASNMTLLLDKQATLATILESLRAAVARTRPDETFLFYYAGHGVTQDGEISFVPYDYGSVAGLTMADLDGAFAGKLQSSRTLLFADCCFSGGLVGVAQGLERAGLSALSLTSATDRQSSVANWTFTEMLVDCFRGDEAADRDADGAITLEEVVDEVTDAMKFHENQERGLFPATWASNLEIAAPAKAPLETVPSPYSLYDYVQVDTGSSIDYGRLVGHENGKFVVELQGYSSRTPLQVGPLAIRPVRPLPQRLDGAKAERVASVNGKYSVLLRELEVEPDYLEYSGFKDYGLQEACNYAGYERIPEGYWVYVYPHWYVWGSAKP